MSEEKKELEHEELPEIEHEELETDYKEAWMRCLADYDNLKKEMVLKQASWTQSANERMLTDLIPVFEHFKKALLYIPQDQQDQDWIKGIVQIKKQMDEFMNKNQLIEIKTVGEVFNTEIHEAVASVESDAPTDQIIEEVSGGYTLNNKVVQVAKVIVSK